MNSKMRFDRWIAISLLIHAAVILPFIFAAFSVPPPKRREVKLEIDLFSMVSDRLVEEILAVEAPDIEELPAPLERKPEPEELTFQSEPIPEPVALAESPVESFETPPQPEPVIESPGVMPDTGLDAGQVIEAAAADIPGGSGVFLPLSSMDGSGGTSGAIGSGGAGGAGQRGSTPGRGQAGTADRVSQYTNIVARRLQANLVYPEKMRRNGVEAVTTIVFTVTELGQIKKDSLQVRKSSGYKEMDDNALRAARDSAPFGEPPREMTLVIDVAFEVGRSRR